MDPKLRVASLILPLAITLGLLGDGLLRAGPWGLNFPVWVAGLGAGLVGLRLMLQAEPGWPHWFLLPLAFAACFAWRDSAFLKFWDFFAVWAGFGLIALNSMQLRLRLARLTDFVAGTVTTGLNVAFGAWFLSSQDMVWGEVVPQKSSKRAVSALVGVGLAVPLALVFGGLLTSADPVFDGLVRAAFDWDFSNLSSHLLLVGFIAWVVAGYARGLFFGAPSRSRDHGTRPALGLLEIGIPLGCLTLMFLAFAAVQARYLFGGEALVHAATGITYAEYARRGFFELVTTTTLVLPVLLAAEWAVDRKKPRTLGVFRALATLLLLLVALIMDSALTRMLLYVDAYGLTADRLYATVFMGWIGAVLIWFAVTALYGDGRRFAFGAVVSGFAVLIALNILNPDRLIAKVNLARAESGHSLDIAHLSRLSADALPFLAAHLTDLSTTQACAFVTEADGRRGLRRRDWRSWNLSRWRARKAMESQAVVSTLKHCQNLRPQRGD
jgi:hypothetical protein